MGDKPPDEERKENLTLYVFHFFNPVLQQNLLKYMLWHLNASAEDSVQVCEEPECKLELKQGENGDKWDAIVTIMPIDGVPNGFLTENRRWQVMRIETKKIDPTSDAMPAGLTPFSQDRNMAQGLIGCSMIHADHVFVVFTEFLIKDIFTPLVITDVALQQSPHPYSVVVL